MLATDRTRWDWEYFEEYFRLGVLWVTSDRFVLKGLLEPRGSTV